MIPVDATADTPPAIQVVVESLIAHAMERCAASKVDVLWIGLDPGLVPAGAHAIWEGDPCRSRPDLRVSLFVDGNISTRLTVTPQLTVWVEAPLAAKALVAGESVVAEWGLTPIDQVRGQPFATSGVARVALDAGAPLTHLVVSAPLDAVRGDAIELRVTRGALTITAPGHLLQDGRVGDRVKVVNDVTKVALDGVLVDRKTVELR